MDPVPSQERPPPQAQMEGVTQAMAAASLADYPSGRGRSREGPSNDNTRPTHITDKTGWYSVILFLLPLPPSKKKIGYFSFIFSILSNCQTGKVCIYDILGLKILYTFKLFSPPKCFLISLLDSLFVYNILYWFAIKALCNTIT